MRKTGLRGKTAYVLAALLLLGVLAGFPARQAFAASVGTIFTVSQSFENAGQEPEDNSVVYELIAQDAESPMPEGAVDGVFTFSISGDESYPISMTYTETGEYVYALRAADSNDAADVSYDAQTYTLYVYVAPSEDGSLVLVPTVKFESGDKAAEIAFVHSYGVENTENTEDTGAASGPGDDSDSSGNLISNIINAVKTSDKSIVVLILILVAGAAICAAAIIDNKRNKKK